MIWQVVIDRGGQAGSLGSLWRVAAFLCLVKQGSFVHGLIWRRKSILLSRL